MKQITTATIFLTQNCNFKCHHCLNRCPYDEEINLEDYKNLILLLKKYGLNYVIFTGGEPTLHRNFKEIIEFTSENNIYFKIISNGFLYKSYAPTLLKHRRYFKKISFSIEGLRKNNDTNRRKGSFDRVVDAVKFFKDREIKVGINFTITKQSYVEYERVIEFFSKLKVDEIHLGSVIRNKINQELILEMEKREKIFWNIPKLMKRYNVKITLGSSLYNYGGVEFCSVLSNYSKIFINQNLQLLYCCNIREPYGRVSEKKINETNFRNLLQKRNKLTQKIRDDRLIKIISNKLNKIEENTCEYCQTYFK